MKMNPVFIMYEVMWGIVCIWLIFLIVRIVLSKEND